MYSTFQTLQTVSVSVRLMTGIIIAHRNKKTLGGASGEGLASGGFYSGAMFGVIQLITSLVIICGLIAATQVT